MLSDEPPDLAQVLRRQYEDDIAELERRIEHKREMIRLLCDTGTCPLLQRIQKKQRERGEL